MTRVGLVGVGTMGTQMLRALRAAGYEVVARDINPQAEARARELGAVVVGSPEEVARRSDVVLLSLPSPVEVAEVVRGRFDPDGAKELGGLLDGARPGQVVADLSTVDPASTRLHHAAAARRGVGYLDAPVLGRPPAVGKWTLPVGGSPEDLARAEPVLAVLARRILRVGGPGSGNIVKLLNNLMFGAINGIAAEVMAICAATGLEPSVFFDAVASSGAATVSNLFLEIGPKMLDRDFSPVFKLRLLHKDMQLALEMARQVRAPAPVASAVQVLNEIGVARGLREEDTSSLVRVLEEWTGAVVRRPGEPA